MAGAGKVITALRAMKYRTREKQLGGPDLAGTRTSP